jgi:hypothetical protein
MSDISLEFSTLELLGFGAIIALPITTIILAVLVALRLRARGSGWRRSGRWGLNAGIVAVAPFWGIGAGLLAWLLVDELIEEMRAARRHFVLAGERTISGVPLPAGAEVALDDDGRLVSVKLPAGTTVTLEGAVWRDDIEFFPTDPAMPARIRSAVPAMDAMFDGISCRGGQPVAFAGSGHLRSCTLAQDAPAQAEIADAQGRLRPVHLACAADQSFELQPGAAAQVVERCTLAEAAEVADVFCAKGSEIEIFNGRLISCALAAAQTFAGVEIPGGSILHLTNTPHRIERFALPALTSPFRAFGIDLPAQAEVWLCREQWEVDQVSVPNGSYIEIAGVRLTGFVNFDCGLFRDGSLYEDTRIHGEMRPSGRTVFRADLDLPPSAHP